MKEAFFLILGAFISAVIGLSMDWFVRRRESRENFLVELSCLESELETSLNIPSFYDQTLIRIRTAVATVRPKLRKNKRICITSLLRLYFRVEHQLKTAESTDSIFDDEFYSMLGEKRPPNQKEMVHFILKKISECAR